MRFVSHLSGIKKLHRKRDIGKDEEDAHRSNADGLGDDQQARSLHRLPSPFPDMSHDSLRMLLQETQDYLLVNGGMLKLVGDGQSASTQTAMSVGVSIYPSPYPEFLFREACELQSIFHELYVAVSRDPAWLRGALDSLIESDPLTSVLWSIFERASRDRDPNAFNLSAGIFRSDYMLHADDGSSHGLKQVEFNTIACAGIVHGQRVRNMHRYLHRKGIYAGLITKSNLLKHERGELTIPFGENVEGCVAVLQAAHNAYLDTLGEDSSAQLLPACILMIVQPKNFNVADERPIEYALWASEPPVPCFRILWGHEMLRYTSLSSCNTLVYKPPHLEQTYQVSVAYFRAGFETREYEGPMEEAGCDARLRFEKSNAVKCPNILAHLTTSKKVQQALCMPGEVERFVSSSKAARIRQVFMPIYPLDKSELGREGRKLATNPDTATGYVLKPSREGGGHNVYRDNIPGFLQQTPENQWSQFVLMKMIEPVVGKNVLASSRGVWQGDVVAELGIWGGSVWRASANQPATLSDKQFGWSVRSKNPYVDEMSVVKGYGCFDSLFLIGEERNVK